MQSPQMLEARDQIAKALLEMNSTVVETIYTGVATATDDPLEIIQAAVKMATHCTLDVIDDFGQIFVNGNDLGSQPFFDSRELSEAFDRVYTEAINT